MKILKSQLVTHTMYKLKIFKTMAVCLIAVSLLSCNKQWDEVINPSGLKGKTLLEVLRENPQTTTFAAIVKKAGYDSLLVSNKMITIFAPNNTALANVDQTDVQSLKALVKNHLSYGNCTVLDGHFTLDTVEMLNCKNLKIKDLTVNGIALDPDNYNFAAKNGTLHVIKSIITTQKNIWEYMQTVPDNIQTQFIQANDKQAMDMTRSVQTGVDPNSGKPIYDTVWINENPVLKALPLNDETKNYSFVMLPNEVISRIETKYSKYFAKSNKLKQDSILRTEFLRDCILAPVEITADGKYLSIDGVKMDISAANIQSTYKASNGIVYTLSDADVKIYENKIKTIIVEAENYTGSFADNMNAWMTRYRTDLSGGKDVVLNCATPYTYKYTFLAKDTTMTYTAYPANSSSNIAKVSNCYLQFNPTLNSVAYKIYWSAYDDYPSHVNITATVRGKSVNTGASCKFSQKLLLSFPDRPVVGITSSKDTIVNNPLTIKDFDQNTIKCYAFASSRFTAGLREEKQLFRCIMDTTSATNRQLGLLSINNSLGVDDYFKIFSGSDGYGDRMSIINPTYGVATLLVANTTEKSGTSSGMIFLDYIKLVPVVDPNE